MDPLSISTNVVALTAKCMQTAKLLYDLRGKYKNAHLILTAICSETTVVSVSLSRLQAIMLESSNILSDSTNMQYNVRQAFETVLTGCMVVFSALDEESQSLANAAVASDRMGFVDRTKVIWKESTMQDLLSQIRNQQSALNMLTSLLQMETAHEIRQKLDHNAVMLEEIARGTKRIRSTRSSLRAAPSIYEAEFRTEFATSFDNTSSIGTADFAFDDILVNSAAYRRVIQAAQNARRQVVGHAKEGDAVSVGLEIPNDAISEFSFAASETSTQTVTQEWISNVTDLEILDFIAKLEDITSQREGIKAELQSLDQLWALGCRRNLYERREDVPQHVRDSYEEILPMMPKLRKSIHLLVQECEALHEAISNAETFSLGHSYRGSSGHIARSKHLAELRCHVERERTTAGGLTRSGYYFDLEWKYKKVKRYYFEREAQVSALQKQVDELSDRIAEQDGAGMLDLTTFDLAAFFESCYPAPEHE